MLSISIIIWCVERVNFIFDISTPCEPKELDQQRILLYSYGSGSIAGTFTSGLIYSTWGLIYSTWANLIYSTWVYECIC